ncbi:MAG: M66 family metalloprotease [Actinomycetota bacterium]
MKVRILCSLTAVALVAVPLAPPIASASRPAVEARYVEPRIGGIYGRGVHGPGSYAVLIDVHHLRDKGNKGGKRGKPVAAANCSNAGTESGTYVFTGWKVGGSRTAHLTTATVPAYLGSVTSALKASWNAWRSADPAVPAVNVATDGTVTRYTANRSYDLLWGRTRGSLATTYTWRWNDGFIESDTVFDRGVTWWQAPSEGDGCYESAGDRYDVANIATHEFGHSYGLGHPAGARFETMFAYGYSGETLKRSPALGDRRGAAALY